MESPERAIHQPRNCRGFEFNRRVSRKQTHDHAKPLWERVQVSFYFCQPISLEFSCRVAGMKGKLKLGITTSSRRTGLLRPSSSPASGRPLPCGSSVSRSRWRELRKRLAPDRSRASCWSTGPRDVSKKEKNLLEDYFLTQIFPC